MCTHPVPTILVALGEDASRGGSVQSLQQAGCTVREAATGAEALRLAADRPDLILVGARLAQPDGPEVCRRLRADPATASIPLLYLPANGADSSFPAGTDLCVPLTTPVPPAQLVALARVLSRATADRRRLEELEARSRELEQANRHKDDFLALLAHELRGPLAPLLNALHLIRVGGQEAAAVAQARELAERQVHQLARLVDDLLDASRVARGKIRLHRERVAVARVVAQAVETARRCSRPAATA
jgi:CheY-like chemotaxis protein